MRWQPRISRSIDHVAKNTGGYRSVGFDEEGTCHNIALVGDRALAYWYSARDQQVQISLDFPMRYPKVAPFPDGRLLIADSRTPYDKGAPPFPNAVIFDQSLTQVDRFHIGDGIEDIQVDQQSRIWVSYFDEGVYGNLGVGVDETQVLGQDGVICLDERGQRLWGHTQNHDGAFIVDCYALNVVGNQANFYFYSDFKLGQTNGDGRVRYTDIPLSGCGAFAIDRSQTVFSGQYEDETPTNCTFLDLETGRRRIVRLKLPDTLAFRDARKQVHGRGKWFHVVTSDMWLGYHMDDLPTS